MAHPTLRPPCCAAGARVIIPSAEGISLGGKAFPSYVAITADGQMLVGEPARRQATATPEGTVTAFKRMMGRREKIRLRDKLFTPEELSAFLLQKIRRSSATRRPSLARRWRRR